MAADPAIGDDAAPAGRAHGLFGRVPLDMLTWAGLSAALLLGLVYCTPLLLGSRIPPVAIAKASTLPTAAPTSFTYVEFAQIERGMTLDQVNTLLGGAGAEQVSTRVQGIAVSQRVWTNQNGAKATVVFADGQVVQTSQVGF